AGQPPDIGEQSRIEGGLGVQAEQPEPDVAQVRTLDGPVAHAGGTERAAVAHAVLEDAPGVAEAAAGFPCGSADLQAVVGPLLTDAKRLPARPQRWGPAFRHRAALRRA